ncbi:methyltransferase domain-containing protein [Streptomyces sp. NPDC006458]|uniref:class I SAM-dependent methyltransferase n=1 Tax=Streptomyces sp. NPDC006458 TaxID=3154302 RepID=UPI0033A13433
MVDRSFADLELARLYDALNPWGPSDDFYLGLVMSAPAVLDIGCGTGRLLRGARAAGHTGRLTGLDPAAAMLVQARTAAPDVEWVLGDFESSRWSAEFGLAVMTGHAFQELLGDEDVRRLLAGVRQALAPRGRFVFETRNPAARAWQEWTPDRVHEIADPDGGEIEVRHEVVGPVRGDRVTFTETFAGARFERARVSRSTLRFLTASAVDALLGDAGFRVVARYGDWGRGAYDPGVSREIVTVAVAEVDVEADVGVG